MSEIEKEALAAYRRYIEARRRIVAERRCWDELADFFTEDAVFIDPAWGRVEGLSNIRAFMRDSMTGLEDWSFPETWTMVDGPRVVSMWEQRVGGDADGRRNTQPGVSILYYAGGGKFCYELDLLNMVHVLADLRAMKWRPGPGAQKPPDQPNRDWSLPAAWRHLESRSEE